MKHLDTTASRKLDELNSVSAQRAVAQDNRAYSTTEEEEAVEMSGDVISTF